ncbi:hypothetical protein BS78_05G118600 [Paspalum vaginatum]|nr:hypothetical protein BS78_05G118600 [Paspalum vaginatum]
MQRLLLLAIEQPYAKPLVSSLLHECLDKAVALAHSLGLPAVPETAGNESLSTPRQLQEVVQLVPVRGALNRIFDMLPQPPATTAVAADNLGGPSIEAVEQALLQMELKAVPPEDQEHVEQQQHQASPASDAGEDNISALFHKLAPPVLQPLHHHQPRRRRLLHRPVGASGAPSTCRRYVEVHALQPPTYDSAAACSEKCLPQTRSCT